MRILDAIKKLCSKVGIKLWPQAKEATLYVDALESVKKDYDCITFASMYRHYNLDEINEAIVKAQEYLEESKVKKDKKDIDFRIAALDYLYLEKESQEKWYAENKDLSENEKERSYTDHNNMVLRKYMQDVSAKRSMTKSIEEDEDAGSGSG